MSLKADDLSSNFRISINARFYSKIYFYSRTCWGDSGFDMKLFFYQEKRASSLVNYKHLS